MDLVFWCGCACVLFLFLLWAAAYWQIPVALQMWPCFIWCMRESLCDLVSVGFSSLFSHTHFLSISLTFCHKNHRSTVDLSYYTYWLLTYVLTYLPPFTVLICHCCCLPSMKIPHSLHLFHIRTLPAVHRAQSLAFTARYSLWNICRKCVSLTAR